jgi:hypothetical protein
MAEVNNKKKIVLVCNTSGNVVGFRRDLVLRLKEEYDVTAIAFDNEYESQAKELGVDFYCAGGSNRSLNPFKVAALKKKYYKIIKKVNPDAVFTFMLKPNIYATVAAKKAGVKRIFSMVEGAGDAFTYDTFKWRMIKKYVSKKYKKAFNLVNKVFFLNEDDRKQFVAESIVNEEKTDIVHGIGIDLDKFEYKPIKNTARHIKSAAIPKFLPVSASFICKGVLGTSSVRSIEAISPTSVFIPVFTTIPAPFPLKTEVDEKTMFCHCLYPLRAATYRYLSS